MSELVETSWKRIRNWCDANAPELLNEAQPGATPEEMAELETSSGIALPDELRGFLTLINGAIDGGVFPSRDDFDEMAYGPMPVDEIAADWMSQNELLEEGDFADLEAESEAGIAADWWNRGWIPFATNGGGDYFCIDTAPAAGGTAGQVIAHSHESGERKKLADSLGLYLKHLADNMEAGTIRHEVDWGLVADSDDDE